MTKTLVVAQRELGRYFNSVVAYAVVVLFLLVTGALYWTAFFDDVSVVSLEGFFEQAPLFLAFFAPAITMGAFAEEKRTGTLDLLRTMPVSIPQIVAGKFLAATGLLAIAFAVTAPYPYTLSLLGDLDWGAVAAGYLGLLLLGGTYNAIGLMASSWTRNQVVAILVAFSLCFVLYFADQLVAGIAPGLVPVAEYASTSHHFESLARGVVDVRNAVYYLTMTAAALVVAGVSVRVQ